MDQRVEDLLGRMTPAEKARMLAGSGWMESFPNERLGIPAIKMADGPMGVRNWTGSSAVTNAATTSPVLTTAFPASIGMASSWDVDLVQAQGRVIAQQVKALGTGHDPGAHGEHPAARRSGAGTSRATERTPT